MLRSTRAAAGSAHQRLRSARARVCAARNAFRGGVGLLSWGSLGDKLARRESATGYHYRELRAALDSAEAAIARAERANAELLSSARRQLR